MGTQNIYILTKHINRNIKIAYHEAKLIGENINKLKIQVQK